MSTKTLRKRIALVAVAALGFGLLSVAPSSAAISADSVTLTAATSGTISAVATNPVTVSFIAGANSDTLTATIALLSTPITSNAALPVFASAQTAAQITANVNSNGSYASQVLTVGVAGSSTGRVTYTRNLEFTPDVAGTYVIRVTPTNGLNTTAVTWTLTVGAALAADSTSTSFIGAADTTATVDAVLSVTMATGTHAATIAVAPKNASVTVSPTVALTATITSGPGTLEITNAATSASTTGVGRAITGTAGNYFVQVFSDGTAGLSTITISSGSTVLSTETINFFGPLASLTATVAIAQIPLSVATAAVVTVVGKDALGNVVVVTPTVTTATAASIASGTCTTSTTTTASSCTLTAGATAGSSVLTFTSGTITTTATVAAAAAPTKVVVAFDKATYAPGEAFTLTLTASNAAGVPADKVYAALLAGVLTPSSSITSTLFGASVTIKNGVATATGFMPIVSGPFSVTGKTGTDATTADVVVSASATITVSADAAAAAEAIAAAADAAAEATDAANAATDAANAAAEAADAATAAAQDAADAVAALSVQVEELVAGLVAQITAQKAAIRALTNLVIKIQKRIATILKKLS